ncbi:Peptidase S8 and S53, subtilisin, kexin, sedolisin:Proprotein convertase, P:Protease-associated PA:Peptidase, archaeal and bacterial:Proteinase inhibitor I9, subtilisin propeptide [Shewanella piezotolerans WP3]|uniref:Peptidase S8 and S53, subtilisin, kexin, sedolisin:Proprotein convertase, P:Protease-associated PA:Peptidase, archaeal and bacterial:Proteinase inhibitor I9, subtilisin propeptide n=1 Tax=Shewanella piezotolerans (strain WP3 / JCM 13877) TaxID=225849 RepID=B8CQ04_SHEPW|nr:S8 family serine peptidase [Shewanella piezotolerans]ACJ29867.1 Peptidase S8 and S53, subtilisin, kexin, sedolisin:Proprotein convertase, P:Protease-associated PA:Peptidase, archaeal and bacterial:Proteinase inhibitor I9, subtilisin propeptide [Shewanella piezotolerans WP3]
MTTSKVTTALSLSVLALSISASVSAAPSFTPGLHSSAAQINSENPLPKRYIVKFKTADAAAGFSMATNAIDDAEYQPRANEVFSHFRALNSVSAKEMKRIGRSNSYTVKLDSKNIQALRFRADVDYVEEDVPRRLLSETTPWGQTYVGATTLSDSQAGNRTICIIDSGYDRGHNDLNANNVTGTNNSGTGNWFDPGAGNAHGTHVAGTIAAIANNEGVVGVMPNQNANIHVIKVFNASGWGYSSSLVSAVDTCVSNGANVVTMSLGGSSSSNTEKNALAAHESNGVLLIAAAGNAGNSTHSYPASYDAVMSVAAVDSNKDHAAFSQFTNQVEISGPGEAILSTVTRGEGRLADITIAGQSYFDNGVVPHNRYVQSGSSHVPTPLIGSVTATLAECTVNGSTFNCGNMANKICLVERVGNQGASYPEIDAVKACNSAGASGVIVYSNSTLPGLQNPFLVDSNNEAPIVSVSVDRATGLALRNQIGASVTVANTDNEDYEYYNGTSMATPHVSGVATLVWSHHTQCSAAQIRAALNATAEDLETAGRDNNTGYGLVDAVAAKAYLDESCTGPTDPGSGGGDNELVNGVAKSNLSGAKNDELHYSIDVPAGATDLSFNMSGGTGDADLYVQYGAAPTTDSYDCRPWKGGNIESCPVTTAQAGTYYVMVQGYSTFSGVNLVANFTEDTGGGSGGTGGAATYTNNSSYSIPDNNSAGVTSTIAASRTGDSGTVTVKVNISHTYIGDLQVELHSPTGQIAILHDNTGGSANDIVKTYTVDMSGADSAGNWQLKAVDSARRDTGTINSWELSFQ